MQDNLIASLFYWPPRVEVNCNYNLLHFYRHCSSVNIPMHNASKKCINKLCPQTSQAVQWSAAPWRTQPRLLSYCLLWCTIWNLYDTMHPTAGRSIIKAQKKKKKEHKTLARRDMWWSAFVCSGIFDISLLCSVRTVLIQGRHIQKMCSSIFHSEQYNQKMSDFLHYILSFTSS